MLALNPLIVSGGQAVLAVMVGLIGLALKRISTKQEEIHVMVNSRLDEALLRQKKLEEKLGLASGEAIPGPPTITAPSAPESPAAA